MQSVDGIEELHMSGNRATFTLAKGAKVEESEFEAAFEERGMKLESFELVQRPRPAARYRADAGVT